MRGKRSLAGLTLVLSMLGAGTAPAAAEAANRFASPAGTGPPPCAQADPCSIQNAVGGAASGDDVTLLGGVPPAAPYTTSTMLTIPPGVTVHGTPGARPLVQSTVAGDSAFSLGSSSALRDVSVDHADLDNAAVFANGGTVERVHAKGAGIGCAANPGSLIRDSVCWTTIATSTGTGIQLQWGGSGPATVTLRNVTAIASGATAPAIRAFVFANDATLNVNATNVIAQTGGGPDVTGSGFPCCTGEVVNVNLDHSNYDSEEEATDGTVTITDPGSGTNVDSPQPAFMNAAGGDFRQTSASTGTINQGVGDAGLGPFDLDGLARFQGTAPDIGAHEFPEAPPATPSPGGPAPTLPTATSPTGQRAAALKKCAKIKNKRKKKRCKARARKLPV